MKKLCFFLAAMLLFSGPNTVKNALPDIETEQAGVDLMLVVAHPGDEYLYLGGVLSYYVSQLGYTAVVVYMSSEDETQREQASAALKKLGVTEEPVFGGFSAVYTADKDVLEDLWGKSDAISFLTETIRQYRPAVVVSHDVDGEYGHAAHKLTASYIQRAVEDAASTRSNKASLEKYGAWQTLRLFLHFYEKGETVSIDRDASLSAFGGRTAAEVEEDLYESFSDEYRYPLDVDDPVYSVADYGLAYSDPDLAVAPENNDFFYGINQGRLNGPDADGVLASGTLRVDAPALEEADEDSYFRSEDDPEEVVIEDWDNEHWEYRTDTLSIIIDRIHVLDAENRPVCYCIAHVRMRDEDAFRAAVRGEEGGTESNEIPYEMARRYQAVLAVTGDNLSVNEPDLKGIIIRNGKIYNRRKAADTMALMPGLSMQIFSPDEITAEELLEMGVTNAFSFGPTLIRDGVVNFNATRAEITGRNPRVGVGMVEPGHFVVITVDGRLAAYSHGVTLNTFMHMFYLQGCKQAYNLDGGSSTAMVFMGEYLNAHKLLEGSGPGQRRLPDMLLWGKSELVPDKDDPLEHDVYIA
ncbi:MAG TPA: phosphodiester glycosidase family protein [Eubacteriales bacterium]|nr:phosphodiester glycosidase family protein [Eubacteriales bacterium]